MKSALKIIFILHYDAIYVPNLYLVGNFWLILIHDGRYSKYIRIRLRQTETEDTIFNELIILPKRTFILTYFILNFILNFESKWYFVVLQSYKVNDDIEYLNAYFIIFVIVVAVVVKKGLS